MTLEEAMKRVAVMREMYLAGDRQETSDGLIAQELVSVVSAERERCARVAEDVGLRLYNDGDQCNPHSDLMACRKVAAEIRREGQS